MVQLSTELFNCTVRNNMGLDSAKNGKLIYHLTSIDNLESIVEYGLLPRSLVRRNRIGFDDIADPEIIDKREDLGLDEYIPFHFHPYSAFDVAVKNRYGAANMVYLCLQRSYARSNDFKVLPKHPLSEDECQLFDYDEGFELIDWDTLMSTNRNDHYAREVKMAECLTDQPIPIEDFMCIYVADEEAEQLVIEKLRDVDFPPPYINIMPVWFEDYD